ncbi:sterol desaturase family protein [Geitlerinema sp. PCC 9228]|jgi:sterol desaturase/sphingolipid hydroxylase (fatty acid hydroxylase superfamily)|uniref:sterol desaturase family protein n=1 Tax=Geitlerinema sp. PCC 9228 TaxID=111611 RepID=UPI000A017963|nr:sterol desaturase family protein [Geitlerinema sp. PCC 9228]
MVLSILETSQPIALLFQKVSTWPWVALIGAIAAFFVASLAEYWMHRLMHKSAKIGERHRDHHRRNEGQGVLWEFLDYVKGSLILMVAPLLVSVEFGWGWLLGALTYAAFSAYAHQLQHDNPAACFWMKMPVHYVHHKHQMWYHNFGLAVDWWDHVFGTYKLVEWENDAEVQVKPGESQLRWW